MLQPGLKIVAIRHSARRSRTMVNLVVGREESLT